jgi:hypothetical protein
MPGKIRERRVTAAIQAQIDLKLFHVEYSWAIFDPTGKLPAVFIGIGDLSSQLADG